MNLFKWLAKLILKSEIENTQTLLDSQKVLIKSYEDSINTYKENKKAQDRVLKELNERLHNKVVRIDFYKTLDDKHIPVNELQALQSCYKYVENTYNYNIKNIRMYKQIIEKYKQIGTVIDDSRLQDYENNNNELLYMRDSLKIILTKLEGII